MPNRLIMERLRVSETCAQMTGDEERHWVRGILLGMDDHGCLEITPAILKGAAYPLHQDVMEQDVLTWNARMEQLGAIRTWTVGIHTYAYVVNFEEHSGACFTEAGKKTRNRRKTPIPPDWVLYPKTIEKPAPLYSDVKTNEKRQPEPDGASQSQTAPHSRSVSVPISIPGEARARDDSANPKPIGNQLAEDAEVQRAIVRFSPDAQKLLLELTTDPITQKPWPTHRRVKALLEFARFEPDVVHEATRIYRAQGNSWKGHRYLIAICEGGATESVAKKRASNAKEKKAAADRKREREEEAKRRAEIEAEDPQEREKAKAAIRRFLEGQSATTRG